MYFNILPDAYYNFVVSLYFRLKYDTILPLVYANSSFLRLGSSMRSTKFWVICFSLVLLFSAVAAYFVFNKQSDDVVAKIYQDGVCIRSINLSAVLEPYSIEIEGTVTNLVLVEPGRICVAEASCPDQVCVHQGWISNGVVPIVCLPNGLVIQIEAAPDDEIDAVAQ